MDRRPKEKNRDFYNTPVPLRNTSVLPFFRTRCNLFCYFLYAFQTYVFRVCLRISKKKRLSSKIILNNLFQYCTETYITQILPQMVSGQYIW